MGTKELRLTARSLASLRNDLSRETVTFKTKPPKHYNKDHSWKDRTNGSSPFLSFCDEEVPLPPSKWARVSAGINPRRSTDNGAMVICTAENLPQTGRVTPDETR